jgi:uracil phosphoribosyltransferase
MKINVVEHPLILHKLTLLRDKNTNHIEFKNLIEELIALLTFEATKDMELKTKTVETPLATYKGAEIKKPVIVPVLRAGLGMLEGFYKILPFSEVGFLGMQRDEKTFRAFAYAKRLPETLEGRQCFLLDPMLATGNTLFDSIRYVTSLGCDNIVAVNLLASPEGLRYLEDNVPENVNLSIYLGAIDERLNEKGYIVPGLGDAGDRLYGIID